MITKGQERRLDQLCGIQKEYAKLYEENCNDDGIGLCSVGDEYVQLTVPFPGLRGVNDIV